MDSYKNMFKEFQDFTFKCGRPIATVLITGNDNCSSSISTSIYYQHYWHTVVIEEPTLDVEKQNYVENARFMNIMDFGRPTETEFLLSSEDTALDRNLLWNSRIYLF